MRGLFFGLSALVWLAVPAHVWALDSSDCNEQVETDRSIRGCTRIIDSGGREDRHVAYNNRGRAYTKKGEYDRAIADLDQAIRFDPKYALAYSNRGIVYYHKGEYDRAIADVDEAIRLDPKLAPAYHNRGGVYDKKGEYDRAIADYDAAIRFDPKSALSYNNRGVTYLNKGEYDRAIADLDHAIRLDPKYARAYVNRGGAYDEKGDYDRAIADHEEAIRIDPKYAPAYSNRGGVYDEKGEYDRAIADLDQAIRLDPAYANPYAHRCNALRHKGDYDHAISDCDQAIRLNPKYARGYANRGDLHAARGDDKRAIADYEEALRIDPKLAKAADAKREALLRLAAKPAAAIAPSANAGLPPKMGRRVALVIGNGSYRSVGRLPNPTRDATAVAVQLKRLGFEVIERYDQDVKAMRSALREFESTLAGADWALVYYAGHGMELDGRNWLIPVDANLARATDVPDEAIELERVLERVREAKRLRIVILDACRNNPYLSRMVMAGGRTRAVPRGLTDIEPEHGEVVFYSARHGTTAEDGRSEHSPFTIALLRYLGEEGLELGLFFRKVTSDVLASTTPKQQPFVYGSIPADSFYFLPPKSTP